MCGCECHDQSLKNPHAGQSCLCVTPHWARYSDKLIEAYDLLAALVDHDPVIEAALSFGRFHDRVMEKTADPDSAVSEGK